MSLMVAMLKQRSAAIHAAAAEALEKAGEIAEARIRAQRIRQRSIWVGWRMIEVGPDQYAFLDRDLDHVRMPDSGTLTLAEAEKFVAGQEKERGWK